MNASSNTMDLNLHGTWDIMGIVGGAAAVVKTVAQGYNHKIDMEMPVTADYKIAPAGVDSVAPNVNINLGQSASRGINT